MKKYVFLACIAMSLLTCGNNQPDAVTKANHPPRFVSQPADMTATATVGVLYKDTLAATDQDSGDVLRFSVVNGPVTIDSVTGIVTWTPAASGIFVVTGRVTDDSGAHADIGWTITVAPATVNGNHPPQFITKAADMTATDTVGKPYKDTVIATDQDSGAKLRFSVVTGPVRIDSVTGIVTWTPTASGIFPVTVRVIDDSGAHAELSWSVTVADYSSSAPPPGMKLIPAKDSTFQMGQAGVAEPVHAVTFTKDFYMDSTEVTQDQYHAVMGTNPAYFTGDLTRPVEQVTWFDAVLYCNELSKLEGKDTVYTYTAATIMGNNCIALIGVSSNMLTNGYRLPTEAEWEYACRARSTTTYWWGPDTNGMGARTWWASNSDSTTHPVATRLANSWGLYDMTGNVWEWCNDWFGPYAAGSATDPTGPASGSTRVLRGGAWFYQFSFDCFPSAYRLYLDPTLVVNWLGFRVVLPSQ